MIPTHKIFDGVCFHRPGTIATRSVKVIGIMVAFVAYNHSLAYVFFLLSNRQISTGGAIPSSNAVIWSLGIYFSADLIWSVVSCNELFWKFKSTTYCVSRGRVVKDSYYQSLALVARNTIINSLASIPMQVQELIGRFPLSDANQLSRIGEYSSGQALTELRSLCMASVASALNQALSAVMPPGRIAGCCPVRW